jgi:hypothetical protein
MIPNIQNHPMVSGRNANRLNSMRPSVKTRKTKTIYPQMRSTVLKSPESALTMLRLMVPSSNEND